MPAMPALRRGRATSASIVPCCSAQMATLHVAFPCFPFQLEERAQSRRDFGVMLINSCQEREGAALSCFRRRGQNASSFSTRKMVILDKICCD